MTRSLLASSGLESSILLSGYLSRYWLHAVKAKAVKSSVDTIYSLIVVKCILESDLQRECKLPRHGGGYTTSVEELGVLPVELLVCIEQEEVRSL